MCLYQLTRPEVVHPYTNQYGIGDCKICKPHWLNKQCHGLVNVSELIKPHNNIEDIIKEDL